MTAAEDVLLTADEAERIFGIPARTIRRWGQEGRLCVLLASGRAWYRTGEVDEVRTLMGRATIPVQRGAVPTQRNSHGG